MFEMIGNFDKGEEKLEGAQLQTALGLTHALVTLFGSRIVFHREMTNAKTCPGTGIDKAAFQKAVASYKEELKEPVVQGLSAEDANKIIPFLSAAYMATTDKEARAEFNRLANELRKASGQPTQ